MRRPIGFFIFLTLILGAAITFAVVYQKAKRPDPTPFPDNASTSSGIIVPPNPTDGFPPGVSTHRWVTTREICGPWRWLDDEHKHGLQACITIGDDGQAHGGTLRMTAPAD